MRSTRGSEVVKSLPLVVTALLIALGSESLSAQEPDPYLVGGDRFGRWTLGMPDEDLVRAFRDLYGGRYRAEATASLSGGRFFFWDNAGLNITSFQGKVVGISAWRRRTAADVELMKYRTKEDIRIGEPLPKAIAAYSAPDRQWLSRATSGNTGVVWLRLGLFLEARGNVIDVIGIFDPRLPWIWP